MTEVEAWFNPSESESESLSEIATCFPVDTDDTGSSTLAGSALITLAIRCKRAVTDVEGSEGYRGSAKAAIFASRFTFASTPRSVASCGIDGVKTEADASGRFAER